jgi:hypothetical protein
VGRHVNGFKVTPTGLRRRVFLSALLTEAGLTPAEAAQAGSVPGRHALAQTLVDTQDPLGPASVTRVPEREIRPARMQRASSARASRAAGKFTHRIAIGSEPDDSCRAGHALVLLGIKTRIGQRMTAQPKATRGRQ